MCSSGNRRRERLSAGQRIEDLSVPRGRSCDRRVVWQLKTKVPKVFTVTLLDITLPVMAEDNDGEPFPPEREGPMRLAAVKLDHNSRARTLQAQVGNHELTAGKVAGREAPRFSYIVLVDVLF